MRWFPIVVISALAAAAPASVFAHAEPPASQTVYTAAGGWVLRANVGIVESSNPTELICEEAFLGGDGWMLGVFGPTEWLTFGENSVRRTLDGCDFDLVQATGRRPSDARVHPESGGAAFLLNGVGDGSDGLWVSTDRGASFRLIQTFDVDSEQTTGVRYLDAQTLVVSGYARQESGAGRAWLVDVASGEATPLQVPAMVTYPYVIGAAAGQVLLLGRRGEQVVFWGPPEDLGRAEVIAPTWPTWAELSPDGRVAYISGMADGRGITRGTLDEAGAATWEVLAPQVRSNCVQASGDDLYMCGIGQLDGFDLFGVASDGTLSGLLDFRDFVGARSDCPSGSDVATVCPLVWNELAPYFGQEPVAADTGGSAPDVGGDTTSGADSGGPTPRDEGGGCATAGQRPVGHTGVILLLLGLMWRRRPLTRILRRCY